MRATGLDKTRELRASHAPSSPSLTGRPSIPETAGVESTGRGVLDRPVKPGDDS